MARSLADVSVRGCASVLDVHVHGKSRFRVVWMLFVNKNRKVVRFISFIQLHQFQWKWWNRWLSAQRASKCFWWPLIWNVFEHFNLIEPNRIQQLSTIGFIHSSGHHHLVKDEHYCKVTTLMNGLPSDKMDGLSATAEQRQRSPVRGDLSDSSLVRQSMSSLARVAHLKTVINSLGRRTNWQNGCKQIDHTLANVKVEITIFLARSICFDDDVAAVAVGLRSTVFGFLVLLIIQFKSKKEKKK